MSNRSKRNKALSATVGMTPIVAMLVTSQPAYAVLLSNASNTVSLCSGVRLPNSDITNVVSGLTSTVGALETTTNGLVGTVSPLLGIKPVTTDITSIMQQAGTGSVTLQAVSTNGTLIGPSDSCYAQANGVTLTNPAGIAIGGNAITGLGDGTKNPATAGELNSIAFGNAANTDATAANAIAMGPNAQVGANATNSIAIGNTALATAANSVALGANSIASTGAKPTYTGYALSGTQASVGEVSVGSASGQRQITNVAAGAADTDAVNVAQLKAVNTHVGALDTSVAGLNSTVNTINNNLAVTNNNLATTNTTLTALTNNVTNGAIGPLRYSDGNGTANGGVITNDVTIVGTGGAVGLHNVANGMVSATSTDAVNGSQLNATNQTIATSVTTINNAITDLGTRVTNEDNRVTNVSNQVTQNSNDIATNATNITNVGNRVTALDALAVKYDASAHTQITLGGTGGTRITNLANGTVSPGSTDAVNGAQLDATNQTINTAVAAINATVGGIDQRVTTNTTDIANNTTNIAGNTTAIANLSAIGVKYDGADHTRITLDGNGGTVLTNVGAGTVSAGSTDAVNGAQLYSVGQSIGNQITNVDNRVTSVDNRVTNLNTSFASFSNLVADGGVGPVQYSDANGVANSGAGATQDVTLVGGVGGAGGAVHVHNVADGTIASGSTDAVNGGQIFTLKNSLTDLDTLSALAVNYDDATKTSVTLGGAGDPLAVSLRNVAAGRLASSSTDAVNGAQLYAANQSIQTVTNSIGDLTTSIGNVDNRVTNLDASVTQTFATVNNTVDAIDARVTKNTTDITTINGNVALLVDGGLGPVQYSNGGSTPNGGTPTNDLTLVGKTNAPVALHNVADGVVAHGSTDAVNGGQLYDAVGSTVSDLAVVYDDSAHTRVSLGGTGAPAVLLTNVKPGDVSAGSTDAVNGAQLYATNQAVSNVTNSVTSVTNLYDTLNTQVSQNTTDLSTVTNDFNAFSTKVANGGVGPVQYSDAAGVSNNGAGATQDVTLVGADTAAPVALHNVAAGVLGAGSTDAVNGSQLAGLGSAVASKLGSFTYNAATNSLSGSFSYGGNTYDDVQSVLGAINASQSSGIPADGKYFHANSDMADSSAIGANSTAIGPASSSAGASSVAMGANATAASDDSVAIGSGAMAMNGKAVSIGQGNTASGDGAVAIGDPSTAAGDGAVVLGKDNNATGTGAIALGNDSTATGDGAAAIGNIDTATGQGAVALGASNSASGLGAIAIGSGNSVTGDGSLAIGSGITTSAADTLAIGTATKASATSAVAVGNRAQATGLRSSAFGAETTASGTYSLAIGQFSTASGIGTAAVGVGAGATGYSSVAMGAGSIANEDYSVALGSASETSRGGQSGYTAFGVAGAQNSLGEIAIARNIAYTDPITGLAQPTGDRQITGLAAGSADTDAVNVAQLRGVSSTIGTSLASSLGGGSSYNAATGSITGPSYTLGGVTFTNVGDALEALARSGGSGTGTTPIQVVDPNAVAYDSTAKASVTLATGGTAIHNVADGTVAAGSQDAVNGGQLAQVQGQVTNLSTQVRNGAVGVVQYSNAATPTTANGGIKTNDVTLVGADAAAPVAIHNVASGTVASGSTDAVNGGQLAATNQRVATVETTADSALSMGQNSVQYDNAAHSSATLGNGSDAVGLHNVAAGTSSTDAVNLGQLQGAAAGAVETSEAYTDQRVRALTFDLGKVRKDSAAGVAGAMALAGMPQPYEAGRGMVSAGVGGFLGQTAIAVGIAKALSDEHTVVKIGATYNSRGQAGANVGIGYQF